MNSCSKILAVLAGTFLSLVTIDINSAQAGDFTFTSIVNSRDNPDFFDIAGGRFGPDGSGVINDNGTVAFTATTSSGKGIFTSNGGGAFTTVFNESPSAFAKYLANDPAIYDPHIFDPVGIAINNTGTVAFGNPLGLFLSNGDNVTRVTNYSFASSLSPAAFNDSGTLVFGLPDNTIATGNGGPLTTVVDTSGLFSFFEFAPAINNANVVAFDATLKDGSEGIFTIKDGSITSIVDTTSSLFLGGFVGYDIAINNTGTVIFRGSKEGGKEGIFTSNGKAITTITDIGSSFREVASYAINNNNEVAFGATLPNGAKNVIIDGIYTGADPVADQVIGIGDSLSGGTVTELLFNRGLNNSGQISFWAQILDSRGQTITGVFRADPVSKSIPESTSTLGILAFGAFGTGLTLKRKLKQKSLFLPFQIPR